ncbi:cache domain-containing protein [Geobacter grbiciae]|uniref:cache domain-containing protein n=1 Tax=Geobacter grbiciae TaxID=155042 RepID=UPI001C010956|nr:cache domain-containing protein [Geobacter grbiciae]MBT1075693.1 cache domain-containing protein [Geobacter grbiciae]
MKKSLVALLGTVAVCLALLVSVSVVRADEKDEAVKMVKEAAALYKANGLEKALDALNDPKGQFVKGALYVFAYDVNGILIANATAPDKIGQNVLDVPDSKGKKFRKEIVERAKKEGSGWVDYTIINPKSKVEEQKTSYFEMAGEMVLGCGIYRK